MSTFRALALSATLLTPQAFADELVTADGAMYTGHVTGLEDGAVVISHDGAAQRVPLAEITDLKFDPVALNGPSNPTVTLINIVATDSPRRRDDSAQLLQAGLHRISIYYVQNTERRLLNLRINGAEIRQPRFFHVRENALPGPRAVDGGQRDTNSYRHAELPLPASHDDTMTRETEAYLSSMGLDTGLRFTQINLPEDEDVGSATALAGSEISHGGTSDDVTDIMADRTEHFALVFSGYVWIPRDARYTFMLEADDHVRVVLGPPPHELAGLTRDVPDMGVSLGLQDGSKLNGWLLGFDQTSVRMRTRWGGPSQDVVIPRDAIASVRTMREDDPAGPGNSSDTEQAAHQRMLDALLDEADASDGMDVLLAYNDAGELQQVRGEVVGLNQDGVSLDFVFRERTRRLALERVAGIALALDRPALNDADAPQRTQHDRAMRQVVTSADGSDVVGVLTHLHADQATLDVSWQDEPVMVSLALGGAMATRNGRRVPLTDELLVDAHTQGYFGYALPYRFDRDWAGQAIRMIDGTTVARGIVAQSRTVMTFDAGGTYERFQCSVSLLSQLGESGDAMVQVLADGEPVFEVQSLTRVSGVVPVDVDVNGCEQLTLVVNYGKGQDVGDRVVFAEPALLRARVTSEP